MNPNLIPVDYTKVGEVIGLVVLLAFMVERSLAFIFESDLYERFDKVHPAVKEVVALAFALVICYWADFDAFSAILAQKSNLFSTFLTGLLVAGGSKGAIKLVQGYLGITKDIISVDIASKQTAAQMKAAAVASAAGDGAAAGGADVSMDSRPKAASPAAVTKAPLLRGGPIS